jgi:hypothetical protein
VQLLLALLGVADVLTCLGLPCGMRHAGDCLGLHL